MGERAAGGGLIPRIESFRSILRKMKPNSKFRTFLHRKLGVTSRNSAGFFDREQIDSFAFNRSYNTDPTAPVSNAQFEAHLAWQREKYDSQAQQAFYRADNFLLLVNSGALAGAITLAARGNGEIDLIFGASILFFFVSIGMLGLSKWCLIAHTNFVRGEFFKNYVRYRAKELTELEMLKADYHANGNRTYSGVFAALSFVAFIVGWILLVAPILSPNGIVSRIAAETVTLHQDGTGVQEQAEVPSEHSGDIPPSDWPP